MARNRPPADRHPTGPAAAARAPLHIPGPPGRWGPPRRGRLKRSGLGTEIQYVGVRKRCCHLPTAAARPGRARPARGRPAGSLLYMTFVMIALIGLGSFAVDLGHVHLVKTDLQRCADAAAHGYMEYYRDYGSSYAATAGPSLYSSANNPVDAGSGVQPTVTVTWGAWNSSNKVFTPGGGNTAVRVVASRTAANGNAVPLVLGAVIGQRSADVTCESIATLTGGQSQSVTVSATANPYLAGMPAGTTNLAGDTASNAAPYQVASIPVTPGTYLTFTNISGTTNVLPGYVSSAGPAGLSTIPTHHGQNYNYTIDYSGPENGIADAIMNESAVMGLFLDDNAPNTTAAPTTVVDWTSTAIANQQTYNTLETKAPFLIGDGVTSGGVTQRFLVPPGATRFYIGIWDGIGYYNNTGSFTATVTVEKQVTLVK
ncbi:MAG TPA: pilus assembly protein TadG-related protein [Humisphaera sp.]